MRSHHRFHHFSGLIGLLGLLLLAGQPACEKGLDPAVGIEGTVYFPVDSVTHSVSFPDSLEGAVVIVAETANYSSVDSFFAHLVGYSAALDTSRAAANYYVQLPSGIYLVGVVGLKISLTDLLFMSGDSLARHPEYFQPIGIYKTPESTYPFTSIYVSDGEVLSDIDISVDYAFELPF